MVLTSHSQRASGVQHFQRRAGITIWPFPRYATEKIPVAHQTRAVSSMHKMS